LNVIPINNDKLYVWGSYTPRLIPLNVMKDGERGVSEFTSNFADFGGVAVNLMDTLEVLFVRLFRWLL